DDVTRFGHERLPGRRKRVYQKYSCSRFKVGVERHQAGALVMFLQARRPLILLGAQGQKEGRMWRSRDGFIRLSVCAAIALGLLFWCSVQSPASKAVVDSCPIAICRPECRQVEVWCQCIDNCQDDYWRCRDLDILPEYCFDRLDRCQIHCDETSPPT